MASAKAWNAGLSVSAVDYLRALRERGPALERWLAGPLSQADVLFTPVLDDPTPTLAESAVADAAGAARVMARFGRCTRPVSFLGLPAVSVPCGFQPDGMPAGFQLIGRPFAEATLLRLGHAYRKSNGLARPCARHRFGRYRRKRPDEAPMTSDATAVPTGRIGLRDDGMVRWLIFDQPAKHNALSMAMVEQALDAVRAFSGGGEQRVLVLTGGGDRAFVSGGDLVGVREGTQFGRGGAPVPGSGQRTVRSGGGLPETDDCGNPRLLFRRRRGPGRRVRPPLRRRRRTVLDPGGPPRGGVSADLRQSGSWI